MCVICISMQCSVVLCISVMCVCVCVCRSKVNFSCQLMAVLHVLFCDRISHWNPKITDLAKLAAQSAPDIYIVSSDGETSIKGPGFLT